MPRHYPHLGGDSGWWIRRAGRICHCRKAAGCAVKRSASHASRAPRGGGRNAAQCGSPPVERSGTGGHDAPTTRPRRGRTTQGPRRVSPKGGPVYNDIRGRDAHATFQNQSGAMGKTGWHSPCAPPLGTVSRWTTPPVPLRSTGGYPYSPPSGALPPGASYIHQIHALRVHSSRVGAPRGTPQSVRTTHGPRRVSPKGGPVYNDIRGRDARATFQDKSGAMGRT